MNDNDRVFLDEMFRKHPQSPKRSGSAALPGTLATPPLFQFDATSPYRRHERAAVRLYQYTRRDGYMVAEGATFQGAFTPVVATDYPTLQQAKDAFAAAIKAYL